MSSFLSLIHQEYDVFVPLRFGNLKTYLYICKKLTHTPCYKTVFIMDFKERKQQRKEHFEKYVKGWKLRPCTACNGSGYYDTCIRGRIPKCGACDGTGKEKYLSKNVL